MTTEIKATLDDIIKASEYVSYHDRWFNPLNYQELTLDKGYKLCSYCPVYGRYKGFFCGNMAIHIEKGVKNYRCGECYTKSGDISKISSDEIPTGWITIEDYFASNKKLCSYIPKDGDNFGNICGLPAVNVFCSQSEYRCKLCMFKESNTPLYFNYLAISKKFTPKRKLTEERWITTKNYVEEHIKDSDNYKCSYSPRTSEKKNLHCYNEASSGERGSFWEYRCIECKSKKDRKSTRLNSSHT